MIQKIKIIIATLALGVFSSIAPADIIKNDGFDNTSAPADTVKNGGFDHTKKVISMISSIAVAAAVAAVVVRELRVPANVASLSVKAPAIENPVLTELKLRSATLIRRPEVVDSLKSGLSFMAFYHVFEKNIVGLAKVTRVLQVGLIASVVAFMLNSTYTVVTS